MSRFLNSRFQAMDAYTPGEQPRDMVYIKLNTNESPYPPAPQVVNAIGQEDVSQLRLYSDPTCKVLREKLAKKHNLLPENFSLANGSDDLLNFAFMAFGHKGAAYADITYGFYKVFATLHGVESKVIPLEEDFSLNYLDYCNLNRLIVIANPNAPTGMEIPLWQIEKILQTNPDNVILIDEAYVDFGGTSCEGLICKYDNLLITRTFSKSRSLAGGRLGYAMASKAIIEDLEKIRYSTNPYNINRLTMRIGEETIDAEPYYLDMCQKIMQTRQITSDGLSAIGFRVLSSCSNFLFASHPSVPGEVLYQKLKQRGILVRYFSQERISSFIRITIGTPDQMSTFLKVTAEICEEASR